MELFEVGEGVVHSTGLKQRQEEATLWLYVDTGDVAICYTCDTSVYCCCDTGNLVFAMALILLTHYLSPPLTLIEFRKCAS